MNTFNYETQSWTSGDDAKRLRVKHLKEEIDLMESPQGRSYHTWRSKQGTPSFEVYLDNVKSELIALS